MGFVIGGFGDYKIVTSRLVAVVEIAVPLVIAMEGIADGIAVFGGHVLPILERAIDGDSTGATGEGRSRTPLKRRTSWQLIVIVIGVAAAHGFAIRLYSCVY
jgi:hypothetical protein